MIGETIGNFKVLSRLGRGGMGEVYLGEQVAIQTRVAIKVLHEDISADVDHVQRFFNEARVVGKIKHAGIVKIFDVGFHKDHAYLVMELLEGESLADRIANNGRLHVNQIAEIGRQIASALAATHNASIIHRDLKPDNIFLVTDQDLGERERVKILDFGIAKLSGTLAGAGPTTVGTMGTPAYMAPEQWGDSSTVDWRADAYSLGCVAFEMACGHPPFEARNIAEACAKHLHAEPPSPRSLCGDVPVSLDRLILRLLEKNPDKRTPSMAATVRAFEDVRGDLDPAVSLAPTLQSGAFASAEIVTPRATMAPRTTISDSVGEIVGKPARRRALAIGVVAAAAAGVTIFMLSRGSSKDAAEVLQEPPGSQPRGTNAGSNDGTAGSAASGSGASSSRSGSSVASGSGSSVASGSGSSVAPGSSGSSVATGSGSSGAISTNRFPVGRGTPRIGGRTGSGSGSAARAGSGVALTVDKGSAGSSTPPPTAGSAATGSGSAKPLVDPLKGRI